MIMLDTQINILIQSLGAWLVPVMQFFSFLGTENIYILLFPAIYWCINPGLGIRMGIALLSTTSLNSFLKIAFHLPRPYWVDVNVIAYSAEASFGFPSGHAQMAASVWGTLGYYFRRPWLVFLAVILILMIGISRLYLGVHFSADVLGGWLFGLIVCILVITLDKPVSRWFAKTSNWIVFLTAAGFGLLFLILGLVIQNNLRDWQIPASWIRLADRGGSTISPLSLKDLFSSVGTWIGFAAGICWIRSQEKTFGKYHVDGPASQKGWRYLLGIAGVLFLWAGLGMFFPKDETITGLILRLVRYGLVGGWISGLAPYVFFRSGLISPAKLIM
ncbi:MAG: phosphatase PAP2 family protein [Leptolinea sp.]